MHKLDIAGLKVDGISKTELLNSLSARLKANEKTFVITPYSEFLYHSLMDSSLLEILNRADFSVPDGIGLFWAKKFLDLPLTAKNHFGKILQTMWQVVYTGAAILIRPPYIRSAFPEKIPGSNLIWDLAKLAVENNKSIFLLGGFGAAPQKVAEKITKKMSSNFHGRENLEIKKKLIAGWSAKNPSDATVINDIKNSGADMVFVAYGPIKQEKWIIEHIQELPATLFIGLGGTFDYVAGVRLQPPQFIRSVGLEWLFRLLTQPHRYKRIFNAVIGLILALLKYKIFNSYGYRSNVVSAVLNEKNEIFIARFNPGKEAISTLGRKAGDFENFWQFPQGGAEPGESVEQTGRRELFEETAIRSIRTLKISHAMYTYSWKNNSGRRLFVNKRYHFKGQEQKIIYFKFTGLESEIILDKDELLEYKWVPLSELALCIHSEKLPLARIILEDLKDLA